MQTQFIIKSISDLENLSQKVKWQFFEKLVAFIFEQNDFEVQQNKVIIFENKVKRQYDVIAKRFDKTFLIECKKQKRLNNINEIITKHKERCELYSENTQENIIPLIVALHHEFPHEEIPIIPLLKLNSFINEIE